MRLKPLSSYDIAEARSMSADSEAATDRHRCVDCNVQSPPTDTNYTLISARYGWRLTRGVDATGRTVMQWRCPKCWQIFRNRK